MEVRRMRAGEGMRLRELRLRALRDAPHAFRSAPELEEALPEQEWERRGRGVVIADDGREWRGMAGMFVDPDLPSIATVWGVWVAPEARGHGIGRRLMEAMVELVRAGGHGRAELTVTGDAPEAAALYESLGFRPTGVTVGNEDVLALPFLPAVPIETERLRLRFTTPDDLGPLLALQSRADVTRWLYWGPRGAGEVAESLRKKIGATRIEKDGDAFTLAIEPKDGGGYAGDAMVWATSHEHRQGELGYILHPDFHGRGYAPEAARVLLGLAFSCFGMRRIVARTEARNTASARVLEKLGMRREAHLVENEFVRDEWQSELTYAMLEREWRATASRDAGSRRPSRRAARP